MNAKRRAAEVIRVSRVNGRDKTAERVFRSPTEQRAVTGGLAKMIGADIVASYEDLDESGGTMDRPGLNAAIEDLRAKRVSVILTAKVDRYTRDVEGALSTLRLIHELGGELRCGDLAEVDFASPNGRYLFTMMAGNAERERGEKRDGLARSTAAATREGIRIAPPPPGYRKGENRRLEPDPETARLVPELFERRARGASWTSIREWWHEETGEWLKLSRIRAIVENRAYLGELRYGDTLSDVRHAALVSEELWNQAQTTPAPRPARSERPRALLAGLLRCWSCGRPMTVSSVKGGIPVYRCQSRNKPGWLCPQALSVMLEKADSYVEEAFLAWAGEAENVTTEGSDSEFEEAEARVAEAVETRKRALRVILLGNQDEDEAVAELLELNSAIDAAEAQRDALQERRVVAGVRYQVRQEWPNLELEQRRALLLAGIESIELHPAPLTEAGGRARLPMAKRLSIRWRAD